MRGAPYVLAFLCCFVALAQTYFAFSPHGISDLRLWEPVLLQAFTLSCAYHVWGRLPHWPPGPTRELVGLGLLVAGLTMASVWDPGNAPSARAPWELATLALALFGLSVHSLQSFLLLLTCHAALLLVGLSVRPLGLTAVLFAVFTVFLLAALNHKEKLEVYRTSGEGIPLTRGLQRGFLSASVLVGLFLLFQANKPPAQPVTVKDWLQALAKRDAPTVPDGIRPQATPPPPLTTTPIGRNAAGKVDTIRFDRDLKFGDQLGARNRQPVFVVDVRPMDGGPWDRSEVHPFWATGATAHYNGRSWQESGEDSELLQGDGSRVVLARGGAGRLVRQRFVLFPGTDRSLFALYPVEQIDLPQVERDAEGYLHREHPLPGRFKYAVYSRPPSPRDSELASLRAAHPDPRYLELPPSLSQDLLFQGLVDQLKRAGWHDFDRVRAALRNLGRFKYSLHPQLDPDEDPTLEFLRRQEGYCQHFASAMALLLRGVGIPTRLVLGFAGGEWDEERQLYLVRRDHGHAWVEVHWEGIGWVPYDPTARATSTFLALGRQADPRLPPPETSPRGIPEFDPTPGLPQRDPPAPPDAIPTPESSAGGTPPRPRPTGSPPAATPTPGARPRPSGATQPGAGAGGQPTPRLSPPATPARGNGLASTGQPAPMERLATFDDIWNQFENQSPAARPSPGPTPSSVAPTQASAVEPPAHPARGAARYLLSSLLWDALVFGTILFLLYMAWRIWRRHRQQERVPPESEVEVLEGGKSRHLPPTPSGHYLHQGSSEFVVVKLYLKMLEALARRGWRRDLTETPLEFARREHPAALSGVLPLTDLFQRARYGDDRLDAAEEKEARAHLEAVLRQMQATRSSPGASS